MDVLDVLDVIAVFRIQSRQVEDRRPAVIQPILKESRKQQAAEVPHHVTHASFEQEDAEQLYGPKSAGREEFTATYMPDEVTRDLARRMHYAAWRATRA